MESSYNYQIESLIDKTERLREELKRLQDERNTLVVEKQVDVPAILEIRISTKLREIERLENTLQEKLQEKGNIASTVTGAATGYAGGADYGAADYGGYGGADYGDADYGGRSAQPATAELRYSTIGDRRRDAAQDR